MPVANNFEFNVPFHLKNPQEEAPQHHCLHMGQLRPTHWTRSAEEVLVHPRVQDIK